MTTHEIARHIFRLCAEHYAWSNRILDALDGTGIDLEIDGPMMGNYKMMRLGLHLIGSPYKNAESCGDVLALLLQSHGDPAAMDRFMEIAAGHGELPFAD